MNAREKAVERLAALLAAVGDNHGEFLGAAYPIKCGLALMAPGGTEHPARGGWVGRAVRMGEA